MKKDFMLFKVHLLIKWFFKLFIVKSFSNVNTIVDDKDSIRVAAIVVVIGLVGEKNKEAIFAIMKRKWINYIIKC